MKSLLRVMKLNKSFLPIILLTAIFVLACEKETEVVGFDVAQTEKLLAGDSTKTWIQKSRSEAGKSIKLSECDSGNTLIFSISKVDAILNPLLFKTSCGDTLLYGGWFAKNDFGGSRTDSLLYLINPDTVKIPDTVYVNYDTLVSTIENITSQFITITRVDMTAGSPVFIKEEFISK